jgi:hypothetical protein
MTLPTLGFDETPPTSCSEAFYTAPSGSSPSPIPASAAFVTQAYQNTMMQVDPAPSDLQYLSSLQSMPSLGRSDTQNTDHSILYNWMETVASGAQAANVPTSQIPASLPPATQHYHAFLQDFYRYEELWSMGYYDQHL